MSQVRAKNPIDRFLTLFADVRAGEGRSAVLLCLNVFILMTAYYIIKPVREALILSGEGGAEWKSYASAGQALLLLVAVPLYGMLASRFPRRRLITMVTLFFSGCLVLFYILARLHLPLGLAFYLWVGIFNLMIIAQFWSFANDLYTPEAGKRLFAIIAFGASLGAVTGGIITGLLIQPLGVYQLLLVSGALLLLSLLITNTVDSEKHRHTIRTKNHAPEPLPLQKGNGFNYVFASRYLLLIAFLMLLLNWVNTTGEYILGRSVKNAAEAAVAAGVAGKMDVGQFIGSFYARFFTVVNILGLLLQLFAVSRILKFLGVRTALVALPIIAIGGYFIMAFIPVLAIVRWAKIAENATDYSLQNTVRQILFLPTSREQKYKAKQAVDTFFVRAGDVLSAVLVAVGTGLSFQTRHFALANLLLAGLWLALAVMIGREYYRMTTKTTSSRS